MHGQSFTKIGKLQCILTFSLIKNFFCYNIRSKKIKCVLSQNTASEKWVSFLIAITLLSVKLVLTKEK